MGKKQAFSYTDIIIGVLITLLVFLSLFFSWKPLESMEYLIYDAFSRLSPTQKPSPVVVIGIDDESIGRIGRWPWPRNRIADAVNLIHDNEPAVIGVDILYPDKESNQGLTEIRDIVRDIERNQKLLNSAGAAEIFRMLREAEKRLDGDAEILRILKETRKAVLPVSFTLGDRMEKDKTMIPDILLKNSIEIREKAPYFTAVGVSVPLDEFAWNASSLGHDNIVADFDGVVRSQPLFLSYGGRLFPSFPLQLALSSLRINIRDVQVGKGEITFRGQTIPVDERMRLFIDFRNNASFKVFTYADFEGNRIPAEDLREKIVIFAPNATGLGSSYPTPVWPNVSSALIIAQIAENIINKYYIVRPAWAPFAEYAVIILFGAFITLLIPRLKARLSAPIALGLLLLWSLTGTFLFVYLSVWIKVFHPALLLMAGYIILMSKRYLFTERFKELIEAESIETNKMLGLSFQGQGMLDLAFEKFRKCPIGNESVKELVYNLGLDYERKRMFNKAVSVYEHILSEGDFKDIRERIGKLRIAGETLILGTSAFRKDSTLLLKGADTKPTLGRYEIVKEIGRGAMGSVYLGRDPKINREVAIKTILYEELDDERKEGVKNRFFREAEAAGKLKHPNIVTVYDVGEDHDIAYMAMELLDGDDLSKFTKKDKLLPLDQTLSLISTVAVALDYAHKHGVVHRDIKPGNIMLLRDKEVRVTDFGIARVMESSKTRTGVILGTPTYMSPEQIAGRKVDGRSDLFSLGVVFYEMVTGELPFTGDTFATLMYNITNTTPVLPEQLNPKLPECVGKIIMKMLEKDTDKRFQEGRHVAGEIVECLLLVRVLRIQ